MSVWANPSSSGLRLSSSAEPLWVCFFLLNQQPGQIYPDVPLARPFEEELAVCRSWKFQIKRLFLSGLTLHYWHPFRRSSPELLRMFFLLNNYPSRFICCTIMRVFSRFNQQPDNLIRMYLYQGHLRRRRGDVETGRYPDLPLPRPFEEELKVCWKLDVPSKWLCLSRQIVCYRSIRPISCIILTKLCFCVPQTPNLSGCSFAQAVWGEERVWSVGIRWMTREHPPSSPPSHFYTFGSFFSSTNSPSDSKYLCRDYYRRLGDVRICTFQVRRLCLCG